MPKVTTHALLIGILRLLWIIACENQTKPDGNRCAICGHIDHQAPECRMNPFNCFRKDES